MEEFVNGANIRKIPSCRHIFHPECLMKWLSGPNQMEEQRCPMCNEVITVEVLERAIVEESAKKKGWFSKSTGISPSPSRGNQVAPSYPHIVNPSMHDSISPRTQAAI